MAIAQKYPRSSQGFSKPLGELNTTPLIDVLLVLLVMFIISIPIGTHSLILDLPGESAGMVNPTKNAISITETGVIQWNGRQVSEKELAGLLAEVDRLEPEPATLFQPDANAQYLVTARVIRVVNQSGISNFALSGNEKFRSFSKAE